MPVAILCIFEVVRILAVIVIGVFWTISKKIFSEVSFNEVFHK